MINFHQIKTKKHGLEFYRSPYGYLFRNWCLSLVFEVSSGRYIIQMRIPGVKASWGFRRLYYETVKPKYRNLFWLSFLFPLHFLSRVMSRLVTPLLWGVGYLIFVVSGLLQSIGHLFMGNKYSAIQALESVFDVQFTGVGIKDILK